MSNMQDRTARTRDFFKLDSWSMDAADAWQHILTGACDDDDLYDNNRFNALDMDGMLGRCNKIHCRDQFRRWPNGANVDATY